MRSSVQPSGGSEGSFTDGALSLLRSSVTTAASKDLKKSPKIAGKAFQTAHDSSGWDRKARWQRAFNLARDKMGIQGLDESVDKWGAGLRESEGGDRRSASAQPVRRGSVVSVGPLAAGAPGTIAELRTPVALKEHLKRGKGARETGIQLVTLEGSGLEAPLSEQDAAAIVAQFDQRRQMLGAPASPSRPALTPADRALKAWTNANNTGNNNSAPVIINAACSGSTSCGSTHSNASSSAGGSSSVGSAGGGSSAGGGVPTGSCTQLPASPAVAGGSGGGSTAGGAEAPTPAGAAVTRVLAVASGSSAGVAVGGSGGSFSGGGSSAGAGGLKLQRRLSENGSAGTGCSDGPFHAMRRNAVVMAPDSIIARSPQHLQCHGPGSGSGSLHRLSLDSPAPAQSLERQPAVGGGEAAAAAPPSPATRGSLSRQNSAAFLVAAAGSVAAVHSGEHAGGWVPLGAPSDASGGGGGGGGGGSLRPTPRPASAGLRATHSPTWAPPAAAAGTESQPPPPPPSAGGEHSGLSPFASAHVSATALAQAQRQPSLTLALPALQVPSPAAERSCSPPRLSAGRAVPSSCSPSTALPATASCGGGIGVEPDARRLASPSGDGAGAMPASLGLHLAATSPIGAAAGSGLLPVPPSSSLDATPGLTGGPRRPRPRASATGDGAIAGSAAAAAAGLPTSHSSGATSQPLPLLQHTGWIYVDASPGAIDGAASAAAATPSAPGPPPPSRLVMHTSPASPSSSHSPSRPGGAPPGYRRTTTSSSGHSALTGPPPPPPASPPMALRPHAPAQPPAPTSPSPPSPSLAGAAYRRSSMPATTAMLAIANGARVAVVVGSPSPAQPSPLRQTAFKATGGGGGGVIVGAVTAARGRLTDDGSIPAAGSGLRAGSVTARAAGSGGGSAAAAARTTPVSDAVLAGLRVVATEVADELSREAEVAAATRQALAQRTRMRVSDSGGKSRHVSMPGDPWRKWG